MGHRDSGVAGGVASLFLIGAFIVSTLLAARYGTETGLVAPAAAIAATPSAPTTLSPRTGQVLITAVVGTADGQGVWVSHHRGPEVDLEQWRLQWLLADGRFAVTFPASTILQPRRDLWLTADSAAFGRQFRFAPDFEARNSHPLVPDLAGDWPDAFDGGVLFLLDADGDVVDAVIVGASDAGDGKTVGWVESAVSPAPVLYRRRDPELGIFLDTDTAVDWANAPPTAVTAHGVTPDRPATPTLDRDAGRGILAAPTKK